MKVFIGTDGENLNSKIAKRFGHAKYYLIYEKERNRIDVISNPEHDEKHQALLEAIENGVKIFIVGNIGPHAFEIINRDGVKIFLARLITAEEALKKLEKNELKLLLEPTVKKSMHN